MQQRQLDFAAGREERAKTRGMVLAAAARNRDLDIARGLAWEVYDRLGAPVSIEDVRALAEELQLGLDFSRNWTGSVFRGWHWAGSRRANHRGSHGRRVGRWVPRRHGVGQ